MRTVKTLITGVPLVKERQASIPGCSKCKLSRNCASPRLTLFGEGEKKILVVLPFPERQEDKSKGKEHGKVYFLLKRVLREKGIDIEKDCWVTYGVKCYNDSVDVEHAYQCMPVLVSEVRQKRPKLVILTGDIPVAAYMGHRTKYESTATLWSNFCFPDVEERTWVGITTDAFFLTRREDANDLPVLQLLFEQSIKTALSRLDAPLPIDDYDDKVKIVTDRGAIRYMEQRLEDKLPIAFDYETSGMKPDAKGHFIQCCSMCCSADESICFLINENTKPLLIQVLKDKDIPKIGHNIKFEHRWSRRVLKTRVRGWEWDTMLAAHFLDNRRGITSLKFQVIINFGVIGYDETVEGCFNAKTNNDINGIKRFDDTTLRTYCAKDSLFTWLLWQKQARVMSKMRDRLEGANSFASGLALLKDGALALAEMEHNGVLIDTAYLEEQRDSINGVVKEKEEAFKKTDLHAKWFSKYGMSTNIHSSDQLSDILYKEMGFNPTICRERSEEGSVSKEAILALGNVDVRLLVEIHQLMKARDTFISQILREVVTATSRIHPSFALNIPVTFRSCAMDPNIQNMPIRNAVVGKIIRTAFVPEPDGIIIENDLKGAEISIAQCHNHDPKLKEYLLNPKLDMHLDMAMKCYMLKEKHVLRGSKATKAIRYCGKNMWVFPQFYGSYYKDCSDALWTGIKTFGLTTAEGESVQEVLRSNGIKTKEAFCEHLKGVEDYFWNKLFPVYTAWKEEWYELYLQRGYVDTLTGFRCRGHMRRNAVINYPIQGDAFHCNLWACIQLVKWLKKNKMRTYLWGQIHDSINAVTFKDEKADFIAATKDILQVQLPARWKWITVPITVEIEAAPMGKSWYEKKEEE